MSELLSAAQMRAIERAAMTAGQSSGAELMERAGKGVVAAVFAQWPEMAQAPRRATVLCGPGNNGGDGFVVARLLRDWRWQVAVYLLGDPTRLPPDAAMNCRRWQTLGPVRPLSDFGGSAPEGTHLMIDALFGTGLSRPLAPEVGAVLARTEAMRAARTRGVAVDIPSGICSDSGRWLGGGGMAGGADLTVTFERRKLGHVLAQGAGHAGVVRVVPLGIRGAIADAAGKTVRETAAPFGKLRKKSAPHKYAHGHALVLSGGPGRTGAARLAARGALRIGAGLVSLAVPPGALAEVAGHVTAVMVRPVADAGELRSMLRDERLNALCVGPGLGLNDISAALVGAVLESRRATVLDADALRLLARDRALLALVHESCVLTPHGGEFAELFADLSQRLGEVPNSGPAFSKVDATREAAARVGCVVLFKGPDTVIAAPDGRCEINVAQQDRAAPWLATAGSGDVLAGFVTGLLARGFSPMQAAGAAAYCHVECALSFGPGLIAEDISEELPRVFRAQGM